MNHRSPTNSPAVAPEPAGTVEPPAIGGRPFVPEQVGRVDPGEDGWFAQTSGRPDQPSRSAGVGISSRPRATDGDGHELFTHVVVPTQRVAAPGGPGPVPAEPEHTERIPLRRLLPGEPEPAGETPSRPGSIGRFGRGEGLTRGADAGARDGVAGSRPSAPTDGRQQPGVGRPEPGKSVPEQRKRVAPVDPDQAAADVTRRQPTDAGRAQPAGSTPDGGRSQPAGAGRAQPVGSTPDGGRSRSAGSKRRRGVVRAERGPDGTSPRSRRKTLVPVLAGAALAAAVALVSSGATGSLLSDRPEDARTLAAAAPAALDPAQAPAAVPGPAPAGASAGSPASGPVDGSPASGPVGDARVGGAPAAGPAGTSTGAAPADRSTGGASADRSSSAPPATRTPARAGTPTPAADRKRTPAPATAPRMIMIIRGEDTSGARVDPADNQDDSSRSSDRARNVSTVFAPTAGPTKAGIARPKTIYAAGSTDEKAVTPLAGKLGLPVNSSFGQGQEAALARSAVAQSQRGPVLISWPNGDIPSIASALKVVGPQPPAAWSDARPDTVWTFTEAGPGTWKFAQMPLPPRN
jgi:hypothetical protein